MLSQRRCTAATERRPEPVQDGAAPVHIGSADARTCAERGLRVPRVGRLYDPRHEADDVPRNGLPSNRTSDHLDTGAEAERTRRIAPGYLAARERTVAR